MSLAKSISDRGSCVCWSPFKGRRELLALGTKEGIGANGFDDYGGRLEIYDLEFSSGTRKAPKLLAFIETNQRFGSIAWGPHNAFPMGIICGGMTDGTVKVWDAQKLIDGQVQEGHIVDCKTHDRCVQSLKFNPHPNMSHILATGGADNSVYIIDLSNPATPNPVLPATMERAGQWHNAAVNTLAWNPQVAHILASAADDGTCIVWDLKNNKTFCTLQHPLRLRYSDVAWNPNEGFQIITAIADDSKPFLQVWDLRKSTTAPFKELQAHSKAVLSIAWNVDDTNILASCGEDGKTLVWDLFLGKPIAEVATPTLDGDDEAEAQAKALAAQAQAQQPMSANDLFSMGDSTPRALTGEGDRRNNSVAWAPHVPGVLACCTFDKKVNIFSLHGIGGQKPPKYMRRPTSAAFAFGGRLASFGCSGSAAAQQRVQLQSHASDPATVAKAKAYLEAVNSTSKRELCLKKAADTSLSESTRRVWSFMALFFSDGSPTYDARQYLQKLLGYEKDNINDRVAAVSGKPSPKAAQAQAEAAAQAQAEAERKAVAEKAEAEAAAAAAAAAASAAAAAVSAEDFFGAGSPTATSPPAAAAATTTTTTDGTASAGSSSPPVSPGTGFGGVAPNSNPGSPSASTVPQVVEGPGDDRLVLDALLVGNFEGVVDVCLANGRMADALMFAFASTQEELWQRAQDAYLAQQATIRAHTMRVVSSVVRTDFQELVTTSKPELWQETLTVLVTFSNKADFKRLSELLGDHLAKTEGFQHAAGLCYLCASHAAKTLGIWQKEMTEVAAVHGRNAALQELIERIHVFSSAPDNNNNNNNNNNAGQAFGGALGGTFTAYANFLADDGEVATATQYLQILPQCSESQELQQRMAQALTRSAPVPAPAPARAPAPAVQQQQQQQQQQRYGQPQAYGQSQYTQPSQQQQYGQQQQPQQQASQQQQQQQFGQPAHAQQQTNPYAPQQQQQQYGQQQYGQQQYGQPAAAAAQPQYNHHREPAPSHSFNSPTPQHSFGTQQPAATTTFNPAAAQPVQQAAAPAPAPAPMYSNPYEAGAYSNQVAQQQQRYQQAQQAQQNPASAQAQQQVQGGVHQQQSQGSTPQRQPITAGHQSMGRPTPGKHMPDGFGSTHAAARNYVEQATAGASSTQSPPSAQPVAEAPAITQSLKTAMARLAASGLKPAEARQMKAVQESTDMLLELLSSGQMQDTDVVGRLVELCQALDRDDYVTAYVQMSDMARCCWKDHRNWLRGFKGLTTLCKKKFVG